MRIHCRGVAWPKSGHVSNLGFSTRQARTGRHIGAFTNNDQLLAKLLSAGKEEGEKLWQFPFDDEYKEQLKSSFADMPNIGGRSAGSITAALFLCDFVGDTGGFTSISPAPPGSTAPSPIVRKAHPASASEPS